jgi:hypothetical protein
LNPRILFLLLAPLVSTAATTVLFSPASPATGPFPTDFLTRPDSAQRTGMRVNLPLPDCAAQATVCQEYTILNQTDGFSTRPRIAVRFSAPVNPATLRDGIYFDPLDGPRGAHHRTEVRPAAPRVAINQVVYDPATNTVYAKPDRVLTEGRRYALIVTDAVKDAAGAAVAPDPAWTACLQSADAYCSALAASLALNPAGHRRVVAASIFTTATPTAWLEHARAVVPLVPASVQLATPQSSFAVSDLSALVLHEQTGANPVRFSDISLPLDPTLLAGVGRVVIGSFRSPRFLAADQTIAPAPTLPEFAVPPTTDEIGFNALLPAKEKPAAGYPVVIFGHGFGDSRFGGPTAIAPALNRAGFAVIAINAAGHGFGPLSTVTFTDRSGRQTTIPALGRSIDLNQDGTIEGNEGCALTTPLPYGLRDCFRQTAVDLMQLARVIHDGLDLDGDGAPDLDAARVYYAGQSLGAMYGTMFTAIEPTVRAAALNVGGATGVEVARWSPAYRDLTTESLKVHSPPLLNKGNSDDEDYVQPDQPVKVTTVPGALAIQDAFELSEWLGLPGDPISFAPSLRQRRVLIQIARADRTMPNPASTLWIRTAGLEANTWTYRHDLARAKDPTLPLDPHPFLVLFVSLGGGGIQLPAANALIISLEAQSQVANFFVSDGASIPDPNGLSRLLLGVTVFEIPSKLPQDLGY